MSVWRTRTKGTKKQKGTRFRLNNNHNSYQEPPMKVSKVETRNYQPEMLEKPQGIVKDFSEFKGLSYDETKKLFDKSYLYWLREKYRKYKERFGEKRINELDPHEYQKFQKENQDLYLLELSGWEKHRERMTNRVLPHFNENDKRILDFGCGVGTNAIAIAEKLGVNVDIYDLPYTYLDFAKFRLKKIGRFGASFDDIKEIPDNTYDVILSWLVFEYTNLERTLPILHSKLKEGGRIIFANQFVKRDKTAIIYSKEGSRYNDEYFEKVAKSAEFSNFKRIPYKVFTAGVMYK